MVDYVLTISISVAAGCDAIFSTIPGQGHALKLPAEFAVVGWLILLNLRGIKESVFVLTPIFLAFIVSHAAMVTYGVLRHASGLGSMLAGTVQETHQAVSQLGWVGVAVILLRAFSLGGGTFTGIEAVSNGVGMLRKPRVENGKKTMAYMASSLAFTAGGILFCYLLNNIQFEAGKTLNASLWQQLAGAWRPGGVAIGPWVVWFTLISEGALLFVAAQTGFLDGPRTLAAMAADEWVPKRFGYLSERLVTQNGVLTMGISAAVVLAYTKGVVDLLVVMYSINVFLTFTLSQVGMARHWVASRAQHAHWKRRFLINLVGAVVTVTILVITASLKFEEGGWITLLATGAFIGLCFLVRQHYRRVRRHLVSLDEALTNLPLADSRGQPALAPDGPTAIVLVENFGGLGIHTVLSIQRMFPRHFKNFVFCSVGLVDPAQFKGVGEIDAQGEGAPRPGAVRVHGGADGSVRRVPARPGHRPDRGARGDVPGPHQGVPPPGGLRGPARLPAREPLHPHAPPRDRLRHPTPPPVPGHPGDHPAHPGVGEEAHRVTLRIRRGRRR